MPFINALQVDHLVLECARRSPTELECFKDISPKIGIGIGVIDIKDNGIESPEQIAATIERVVKILGSPQRIHYVHPDCGFWMLQRSVADRKMAALVQGRDLYLGR